MQGLLVQRVGQIRYMWHSDREYCAGAHLLTLDRARFSKVQLFVDHVTRSGDLEARERISTLIQ
jgi:hypothetical protein